jgi:hypothetical protein
MTPETELETPIPAPPEPAPDAHLEATYDDRFDLEGT